MTLAYGGVAVLPVPRCLEGWLSFERNGRGTGLQVRGLGQYPHPDAITIPERTVRRECSFDFFCDALDISRLVLGFYLDWLLGFHWVDPAHPKLDELYSSPRTSKTKYTEPQ